MSLGGALRCPDEVLRRHRGAGGESALSGSPNPTALDLLLSPETFPMIFCTGFEPSSTCKHLCMRAKRSGVEVEVALEVA